MAGRRRVCVRRRTKLQKLCPGCSDICTMFDLLSCCRLAGVVPLSCSMTAVADVADGAAPATDGRRRLEREAAVVGRAERLNL